LRDVSESNPEVFADLQKSLVALLEKGAKWDRAFVYTVQSEEQREQLKVLGYVK